MAAPKLDDAEVATRLAAVPRWRLHQGKLRRELRFASFGEAFGFLARVALAAEKRDHHPDWSNSYDRVVIELSSHDVGGLSKRDFELAAEIDRLLGEG